MADIKFVVVRDYYLDGVNASNVQDEHVVLFGTRTEADEMMSKLNGGCDPSFFPVHLEDPGFLYVDERSI